MATFKGPKQFNDTVNAQAPLCPNRESHTLRGQDQMYWQGDRIERHRLERKFQCIDCGHQIIIRGGKA